jgi:hypothetical protein
MTLGRRELLTQTGLALAAGAIASSAGATEVVAQGMSAWPLPLGTLEDWAAVRAQFALSDDFIHMSAMLISSHPKYEGASKDVHLKHLCEHSESNLCGIVTRPVVSFSRPE